MHVRTRSRPEIPLRLICSFLAALSCPRATASAGQFEVLGVPVKSVLIMGAVVGVDENTNEVIYFNCAQPGNRLFLLQVNPANGEARQFAAPVGEGAWASLVAPDQCVYLGTWESGYLLKFDPRAPEKGLVSLGKPAATETYLWQFALGTDGRIYSCTYPQARLVRHEPRTGKSEDLGRLDEKEMYARSVASSTNGLVYAGIGTVRSQIVRFDPMTGNTKALLSDDDRVGGTASVFRAIDGRVYAKVGQKTFRCDGDALATVETTPATESVALRDGRVVGNWRVADGSIAYTLTANGGKTTEHKAGFTGDGIQLFTVGAGPGGRIYGSTAMPLEMFDFIPATRALRDLGNPTAVGGEIYSFATDGKVLYLCAYPGGFLSIYDPTKEWNYGTKAENNPRGFGSLGDGHLRPRAMVMGPDGRIYVGSLPPYGQVGGALGVYDPNADKVVENYRHLVTDQGISALCVEPATQRIFGGSSIAAGGGGKPSAKECVMFCWNWKEKRKEWESVVVPGDTDVVALTAAHGKVFGVSRPSQTLFVLDAKTFQLLHQAKVPFGSVHDISLGYHTTHDSVYGLAGNTIFSIDPGTFNFKEVARSAEPITCGFAITETGIYFGSKTRLMRWRWETH
jgi:hypothetical protein